MAKPSSSRAAAADGAKNRRAMAAPRSSEG
jgi:hypothetical protein